MAKTKYGKYIITQKPKKSIHPYHITTVQVDKERIKGAFYLLCELVTKKIDEGFPQFKPHNHDFNEYLIFLGTDPKNPDDLGGEVEIWLGDEEKYTLTKSCAVFVPKGLYHTPLTFKRVDRPIVMIRTGDTLKYSVLSYSKHPRWAHIPEPPAEASKK